ncbi:MAG: UDP-3-O-acyl-N-acetylglucosamine deacetylase [Pseudomonadota bacterium]
MLRTIGKTVEFRGVGLHGGQDVTMSLEPMPAGSGIRFIRVDVPVEYQSIEARYDCVSDTRLCTKITNEYGVSVGTVEHVMAALAGCGINDALIALDGPEVPIMDGSSAQFVEGIMAAGIRARRHAAPAIRMLSTVRVENGDRWAALSPADRFCMKFRIEFDDPAIGTQEYQADLVNGAFVDEFSNCRTFGRLSDVEDLKKLGLGRGGGLHNAIVVDDGRVLNRNGLRRPDEFVRHKMLDAIGDLALAGAPIIGAYTGVKAGHEMTNRLLRVLFETPGAWEWDVLPADMALGFDDAPEQGRSHHENRALAV